MTEFYEGVGLMAKAKHQSAHRAQESIRRALEMTSVDAMAFRSISGMKAVSLDEEGQNLPEPLGPWSRLTMESIEEPKAIQVLKKEGYYLFELSN